MMLVTFEDSMNLPVCSALRKYLMQSWNEIHLFNFKNPLALERRPVTVRESSKCSAADPGSMPMPCKKIDAVCYLTVNNITYID